eukprot:CAMPEP_0168164736 /NCGR_PEP_ID=MMETSP0139_2-20121125/1103_1 /TAXON_ID=44445 /ORGANISM="Pseudo-nitzschia australis, Strain 10249 10 AB" /LENGTH=399 /DNA_ID=CAMNT_0008081787 /DNA_START=27 /DNA_END=1224 /DNA_ORIENTATION=-
MSSPPRDLFITSQSPIPRLTYRSPDDNDINGCNDEQYGERISLGRDSDDLKESILREPNRESDKTIDSLATNTPPARYRSEKEKRRAFREVPVNVTLKKGATFHLEKIAVKRTERISSRSVISKTRYTKPTQRRRLVNFPDPLGRYGSRKRRALKEMYSWVRHAERDYEDGKCSIQAVGAFFSLSEEQIIDVSLKLLLSDYAENPEEPNLQSGQSALLRTQSFFITTFRKNPSVNLRKDMFYDVVLTTYDAMKSPDVAIPVTADGHAIVTKSKNDGSWHTSRSASQEDKKVQRQTKQLSVLHRIEFRRIIFLDILGRKSYLAKVGTARAAASVAISSSSSRLVFFKETEADGSNALMALRKSDKRAFQSVSSALHITDNSDESGIGDSSDEEDREDPFE